MPRKNLIGWFGLLWPLDVAATYLSQVVLVASRVVMRWSTSNLVFNIQHHNIALDLPSFRIVCGISCRVGCAVDGRGLPVGRRLTLRFCFSRRFLRSPAVGVLQELISTLFD